MRRISIALLPGLVALVLTSHAPAQQPTWTETWQADTSAWWAGTGPNAPTCATAGGVFHWTYACGSGQVWSVRQWQQGAPVTVAGTVRGQPDGAQPYFCGLVLFQGGQWYGQDAVGRNLAPTAQPEPTLIWYVDESFTGTQRLGRTDVQAWHSFQVAWTPGALPNGTWTSQVDGKKLRAIRSQVPGPVRVVLQGFIGPGGCEFGPITVTGIPL